MDNNDINNRFEYHAPDGNKASDHETVRGLCKELAHELNRILPEGREKSLAMTHLEDTMMWANASIARN